ncbi:hypothetical protein NFJ02_17g27760 [Pycnococcus provasolii]
MNGRDNPLFNAHAVATTVPATFPAPPTPNPHASIPSTPSNTANNGINWAPVPRASAAQVSTMDDNSNDNNLADLVDDEPPPPPLPPPPPPWEGARRASALSSASTSASPYGYGAPPPNHRPSAASSPYRPLSVSAQRPSYAQQPPPSPYGQQNAHPQPQYTRPPSTSGADVSAPARFQQVPRGATKADGAVAKDAIYREVMSVRSVGQFKRWVFEGPGPLRVLAVASALYTSTLGILGLCTSMIFRTSSWADRTLQVYMLLIGFLLLLLEGVGSFPRRWRSTVEEECRFLRRLSGRSALHLFAGSLFLCTSGTHTTGQVLSLVGIVVEGVTGVFGLVTHFTVQLKLKRIMEELTLEPGQLTVEQIRERFDLYDIDHNGTLSTYEMGRVAAAMGISLSRAELVAAIDALDRDHSGEISFDEFVDWFATTGALTRTGGSSMSQSQPSQHPQNYNYHV